jgi:uncharacterized membrane protein
MGLIRRYGAGEPTVIHALLSALTAVLLAAPDDADTAAAVEHQADLLIRAAERCVDEPGDLRDLRAEDVALRQALDRSLSGPRIAPAGASSVPGEAPSHHSA